LEAFPDINEGHLMKGRRLYQFLLAMADWAGRGEEFLPQDLALQLGEVFSKTARSLREALRLDRIPGLLSQAEQLTIEMNKLVQNSDLFVAEPAFKDLKANIDIRKSTTLCEIEEQEASAQPNVAQLSRLADELKLELSAISHADDALADYIKKLKP
jgi:hypothetical protein